MSIPLNPFDWFADFLEAQRAQIEAAEKLLEASRAEIETPAGELTEEERAAAAEKTRLAAEELVRTQWAWLTTWRF